MDVLKRPLPSSHNKRLGDYGEELSAQWLTKNGYTVIERNFRNRFGEIDIIATKDKIIYCIEVKTRSSTDYGYPWEAINNKKLHRMKMVAQLYEQKRKIKAPIKLCVMEVIRHACNLIEIE
jgi:putative endonuclease